MVVDIGEGGPKSGFGAEPRHLPPQFRGLPAKDGQDPGEAPAGLPFFAGGGRLPLHVYDACHSDDAPLFSDRSVRRHTCQQDVRIERAVSSACDFQPLGGLR
jgi:hypothetical protein